MGFEYANSDSTEIRWLILSDLEQEFPTETFAVEEAKEALTSAGKAMPVLTLKGVESGDLVQICAWKRDVSKCIKQLGSKPEQWTAVRFAKNKNRYELVPADLNVQEVTV